MIFDFQFKTGLRITELLSIKNKDIKKDSEEPNFYWIKIYDKTDCMFPKEKIRYIKVPKKTIKDIRLFFNSTKKYYLFTNKKNNSMFKYNTIFRYLKRHNLKTKTHALRHSKIVFSLKKGHKPEEIAHVVGHSMATFNRVYKDFIIANDLYYG